MTEASTNENFQSLSKQFAETRQTISLRKNGETFDADHARKWAEERYNLPEQEFTTLLTGQQVLDDPLAAEACSIARLGLAMIASSEEWEGSNDLVRTPVCETDSVAERKAKYAYNYMIDHYTVLAKQNTPIPFEVAATMPHIRAMGKSCIDKALNMMPEDYAIKASRALGNFMSGVKANIEEEYTFDQCFQRVIHARVATNNRAKQKPKI